MSDERRVRRVVFCGQCETANAVNALVPRHWIAMPWVCCECKALHVLRLRRVVAR